MEFRKMVTITLCTRQQKRHWCIEQSFGLCGRGRGWDDLGEYIYIYLKWGIVVVGFPGGSDGKESACNVGDLGLIT